MILDHVGGRLSRLDAQIVAAVPEGGNWRNLPETIDSARVRQIRESAAKGKGSRSTMLYCMAGPGVFPERERVGIPELAEDFGFTIEQVGELFDCDPESNLNSELLSNVVGVPTEDVGGDGSSGTSAGELPEDVVGGTLNSGVGAEILIAKELQACGWQVLYRGNQPGLGYDLEASRDEHRLFVEVKSSIGFANLELRESEWTAAQASGGQYVLAVVDFFGSSSPRVWYVRDPAANAVPEQRTTVTYRFGRALVEPFMTEVDFL